MGCGWRGCGVYGVCVRSHGVGVFLWDVLAYVAPTPLGICYLTPPGVPAGVSRRQCSAPPPSASGGCRSVHVGGRGMPNARALLCWGRETHGGSRAGTTGPRGRRQAACKHVRMPGASGWRRGIGVTHH